MSDYTRELESYIRNRAWMVRHYARCRGSIQRRQAIQMLGLAIRRAFNESDDFEPLLLAVLDGLSPKDEHRF